MATLTSPAYGRESDFQNAVVALARLCGWRVMHSRPAIDRSGRWSTPILGDKGYPDLTMAHPHGMLVFAELKVGGNRPSPDQIAWLQLLQDIPGRFVQAFLWTPADWPEIQLLLQVVQGRPR